MQLGGGQSRNPRSVKQGISLPFYDTTPKEERQVETDKYSSLDGKTKTLADQGSEGRKTSNLLQL